LKILSVIGTRPEAIKMAPLIKLLNKQSFFDAELCVTAQHREMLDQVLEIFNIKPNYDLNIMQQSQGMVSVSAKMMTELEKIYTIAKPDIILVHGDTNTCFAAAYVAFMNKIKVGHVEAGLRTGDLHSPWPEEINRKLTTSLSEYHFVPTAESKINLQKEDVCTNNILITGNTVIDALRIVKNKFKSQNEIEKKLIKKFININFDKKIILVTGHRRENFGTGIKNICKSLKLIAAKFPDVQIVYPVHMNPNVAKPVNDILREIKNIYLLDPLDYLSFVFLMSKSHIILTDSGGIQEEAPSLSKPVLVMRDTTERPEAEIAGTVKLVGTCPKNILSAVSELLSSQVSYNEMSNAINPYGNGYAAEKIVKFLKELI